MNNKVLILLFAVWVTGLLSCKKGSVDLPPFAGFPTNVNVVNATADTLSIFQNGTRINNTSDLYPNGSAGYLSVISGEQNYQIKKARTPNVLLSVPLTLDTAKIYSLFIAGTATDRLFLTRDSLIVDSLIDRNHATVRFVNASPEAVMDVKIGDGFDYKDRAFKSATGFVLVKSGVNALTIYRSGNATPIGSGTLNLAAGGSYTLFAKGAMNGSGNNVFGTRLIRNR